MTSLRDFWPSLDNISDCIRTEAEVLDEAVLLAVHEPGALIRRSAIDATERPATEDDVLKELMRDARDGSAVLVAITGDSGVGKSHLVRWLYAQLRRHARRKELVVVLVPKTASLRQVVELILKARDGEAAYQRLLAELRQTVDALNPPEAAAMLSTALSLVLQRKFDEGLKGLVPSQRDDRALRERLDLTKKMCDLIREPEVFDQWMGGILERIVRQTILGGSEQQTGEQRRFVPADLEPPPSFSPDPARRTIQSALLRLASNDGANRELAADILQEALDPALRDVFKFSQALGQRTIEEIVDDIRRELLEESKELVLLIEDFAALAGIQQPLLNLMIAESDHGGTRVRAPIRTALAVTDGFLPSRQTILTRAKYEWKIPSTATQKSAIIERFVSLAGRYLNAARWGASALREQFSKSESRRLDDWVQSFPKDMSDDDARRLSAFGLSEAGYPLFPLSRLAIEAIVTRELSPGGVLQFNPRAFINRVLRETLDSRPLFEEGRFPPPDFKGAAPTPEVQITLASRGRSEEERGRLAPVLDYWAGNPASLADAPRAERGVFEAFSLPWPFVGGEGRAPAAPSKPVERVPNQLPAPPTSVPPTAPSLEYIDTWARGTIDQAKARRVRNLLVSALKARTDWSAFRLRTRSIDAGHLWLPFARTGNPSNEPKFVVGEEARPVDAVLLAGVRALERWSASGESWNYERAEDDYAVAQVLLDRIEQQVFSWHSLNALRRAGVALQILHRQALLLRLTGAIEPDEPSVTAYFSDLSAPLWRPETGDTRAAATSAQFLLRADATRAKVRGVLADAVGCFQGEGRVLLAIDPRRTQAAWKLDLPDAATELVGSELGDERTGADEMLTRIEPPLKKLGDAVEPVLSRIQDRLSDLEEDVPESRLREPLEKARAAGLFAHVSSVSFEQAKRRIEALSTTGARKLIGQATKFTAPSSEAPVEERLRAWAAFSLEDVANVSDSLEVLDKLLSELERAVSVELRNHGGADVGAMIAALKGDLDALAGAQGR